MLTREPFWTLILTGPGRFGMELCDRSQVLVDACQEKGTERP